MPEAGLSVPRGRARRTSSRHDGDPADDPRGAAADRAARARDAVASGRISDAYDEAVSRRPRAERATRAAPARPAGSPGRGVPGRRTVTIQGRGAERYTPKRRPARRPHERAGFKPDRVAMWAVLLGFLLVLVAATSSHGAVLHPHALTALHSLGH
jgi:hypothetical protein